MSLAVCAMLGSVFCGMARAEEARGFLETVRKHVTLTIVWDEYIAAYEECLTRTNTKWAPWYVIPADHKWLTHALVASVVVDAIHGLDLTYPELTPAKREEMDNARKLLEKEGDETAS